MSCKCGSTNTFTQEKGACIGLYCQDCGRWQKWLSKAEQKAESFKKANEEKERSQFSKEELTTIYRVLKIVKLGIRYCENPSKGELLDAQEYQLIMDKIESMF